MQSGWLLQLHASEKDKQVSYLFGVMIFFLTSKYLGCLLLIFWLVHLFIKF